MISDCRHFRHFALTVLSLIHLLSSRDTQAFSAGHHIDDAVIEEMGKNGIVGVSVAVVWGDRMVYAKGFGYADIDKGIRATPHTIYRMGSLSKVLTGTAVMQLAEQGVIDLDAPIDTYLPEFSIGQRFEDAAPITVRRLLTHHAGFPTDLMQGADTKYPETLDALMHRLRTEFTAQPAGRVFQYSNLGYAVLGALIERVTGLPYDQYMTTCLFAPLGMNDTAFALSDRLRSALSQGYLNGQARPQYPVREQPAAGVYSSVMDLGRFVQMVLNNGRLGSRQHLHPATLQEMLRKQNTDAPRDLDVASGISWQLTHRMSNERNAGPMAWHEGWLWHFTSAMALLPEHRLGVVVAANTDSAKTSVSKIAKSILRRLLWEKAGVSRAEYRPPPQEVPLDEARLEPYVGHYDTAGGLVEIRLEAGHLEWYSDGGRLRLVPLSDGTFAMDKYLTGFITYRAPDLDGKRLRFVRIRGETILATLDNDVRIPMGRKLAPVEIPVAWKRRLGAYVNPGAPNDFVKVKEVRLNIENGFLVADVIMGGPFTRDMRMTVALHPDTGDRAFVMGVGRYRGDTLRLKRSGNRTELIFQGYHLIRRSRREREVAGGAPSRESEY